MAYSPAEQGRLLGHAALRDVPPVPLGPGAAGVFGQEHAHHADALIRT